MSKHDPKITLPSGTTITVPYASEVHEIFKNEEFRGLAHPVLGALVNNESASLSFKLKVNASVKPVTADTTEGARIYRRSLCFLLAIASRSLFPDRRLVIGHSLGDAYFYYYDGIEDVAEADIDALRTELQRIVSEDRHIERHVLSYSDALHYLESTGQSAAVQLLEHRNESKIPIYECGDFRDISHGPLVPGSGIIKHFDLRKYHAGFLLCYPPVSTPDRVAPFQDHPVVSAIFREYKRWGEILRVNSAGRLNTLIRNGEVADFIRVAEALHERKISRIADQIRDRRPDVRMILIAGPSSSGKTTFTKKLAIQLRVHGLRPLSLSTDDYYLPRELTPRDEDGNYDFESLAAIDVDLLNDTLMQLMEGREVRLPEFDFKSTRRREKPDAIRMDDDHVLLIEGIHGLNPALTERIPSRQKYRIYISALTQLNIDDHNRIPTTDVRLLRRLVRDHKFRSYSALETIKRWPSVRRGENKNIFPYEDNADVAFNSALDYELPILKAHADPLLRTVKPFDAEFNEAVRLSLFLDNFVAMASDPVPSYSILREFIGGSGFTY